MASKVIEIAQSVRDKVEGAKALSDRVDLLAIEKDIQKAKRRADASRVISAMRAALGRSDISGLLASCSARLDWAMKDFEVQGHIQESIRLAQMSDKLDQVHDRVGEILVGLRESNAAPTVSLPFSVIPPKPELFYGREVEVNDIAHRIVSSSPARFGVIGPGGIGKTSLVSAVVEHTDVIQCFGSYMHWSCCDEATSPQLLVEVIARSSNLDQPSKDRLQDIKLFLHSATQPRPPILDNSRHQLLPLAVLPAIASRDLYVEIDPKADGDPALETLLSELDHMPLAVTLMAKVGSEGETPTELLKEWRTRGADMMHEEGGDRRTSVNLPIQLSLHSHLMKNNPEALQLLRALAVLPGGIRNDIIPAVVPDILEPKKARSVLLRTSPVYSKAETNSFHMLSPIRTYIAHHHPPTVDIWRGLHGFGLDYIVQHYPDPWDHKAFIKALAIEDANLEAILLHALQHDPSEAVIETSLGFMSYQHMTDFRSGPRLAIATLNAAEPIGTAFQVARCHARLGEMYLFLMQLEDARFSMEDAYTRFLQLGEEFMAADCARILGHAAYCEGLYDDARRACGLANHKFSMFGRMSQSADCLITLGFVSVTEGRFIDARRTFEEARAKCLSAGDDTMECLHGLGYVARVEGRYENSQEAHEQARTQAIKSEDQFHVVWNSLWLGATYTMREQYGSARQVLREVYAKLVQMRQYNGVAECLKWLGNVDRGECQFEAARRNLETAHQQFVRMGQVPDVAECLQCLGYTEALEGRYKDGRQHLEEALGIFRRLGIPKGVADSLTSLGELSTEEGHVVEARAYLDEALASYEKIGAQDWWQARCVALLANLPSPSH
ncbi:hypothetical protein FRB94_005579 [Tulasnella sp. JGI-2019a]|nr:hypothetical protein FRB94_005579 [Tulasnella sp. JGI-2019a]